MCGIAGFLPNGSSRSAELEPLVRRMTAAIAYRGPDDAGAWVDREGRVALGHRRLTIVELSAAGHQPMVSENGRYVLAFNGEIYNHLQLRAELEASGVAPQWRGHSDTETLLAAFLHWGLESTLIRAVGMFAIALWDTQTRVLHLARDRFGEKPLYYGWADGAFLFGSDLNALRAFPRFANPVDRGALQQYLRFMYVPAPRSIYEGIYKLEPGCILSVRGAAPSGAPAQPLRPPADYGSILLRRWWSLSATAEAGAREPLTDETAAIERLEARISEAVRLQSLADVPVGAFLSGGVDSSAIVALLQRQSSRPVKTFTIGFEEAGFDESPHARAVARHLGTEHTELMVTAAEARAVIPALPAMYGEPFADSSQIPTHLVCQAARRHVTVALSGDAGDELFGGYNRYFWGPSVWDRVAWLPYPVRRGIGSAVEAVPVPTWDAVGAVINRLKPHHGRIARAGAKAHKLAGCLRRARSMDDVYLNLVSEWPAPGEIVMDGGAEPTSLLADALPPRGVNGEQDRMMYRDAMTYLPDDILCKVDRAAMAVSLETRVPFLDHRVAELAWQLPVQMKIRGLQGKWILRQVLYRHVPRHLIERPKAGFALPLGQWLRGPLREWAESLLGESRLRQDGYLRPEPVRRLWEQHLSGRFEWTPRIWSILMFQAWLEEVR